MELIDKSALVSEITSLKAQYECGWNCAIDKVLERIDDLEVKEVDLEEEIKDWLDHGNITVKRYVPYYDEDIEETAKHFFELGLKAQKGE